jgi:hypothetical protein
MSTTTPDPYEVLKMMWEQFYMRQDYYWRFAEHMVGYVHKRVGGFTGQGHGV